MKTGLIWMGLFIEFTIANDIFTCLYVDIVREDHVKLDTSEHPLDAVQIT